MATYYQSLANKNYRLELTVNQVSQSIANNTSVVSWSLAIRKLAGTGYWSYNASSWSVNIGGINRTGNLASYDFRNYSLLTLGSGTVTITHADDGSKSISNASWFTDGGSIGNGGASGVLALSKIPRTSNFGAISGNAIGGEITVNVERHSTAFTHSLWYSFGNLTWQAVASGIGTQQKFTLPLSVASQIPNSDFGTLTLILRTMQGSTQIGTDQYTNIRVNLPASVLPTFTTITHSDTDTNVQALVGEYVKSLSKLRLTITGAAGVYGSTIRNYKIEFDNQVVTAQTGVTNPLNSYGTLVAKGTVTDSRGRSVSKTVNISVRDYAPPRILSATAKRTWGRGDDDIFGEYFKIDLNARVDGLSKNGTVQNKMVIRVDAREKGGSWVNERIENPPYDYFDDFMIVGGFFLPTKSYDVRITVSDLFSYSLTYLTVSSGGVTIDMGLDNIGVGKLRERGTVDAIGQMFHNDGIQVQNGYVGGLPAGDINNGAYWRGLKVGSYWKTPEVAQTGQLSQYAQVWVLAHSNDSIVEKTIFWKEKADGNIWHSGTNANTTTMNWKKLVDEGNLYTYDSTNYQRLAGVVNWLRSPLEGIIPFENNRSSLGTDGWRFKQVHTNTLSLNGTAVLDHVIEQGSNHRKWASGSLEQWGAIITGTAITTAMGSGFRLVLSATTFPRAFTAIPMIQLTAHNYANASINTLTATTFQINLTSFDSGRIANRVDWYASGRWK